MITSDQHFLLCAFKAYDNPKMISTGEFDADLKRFNYLNLMLNKFSKDQDGVKLRTCVNHIVILSNCFCDTVVSLIRYKVTPETKQIAETIMFFLKLIDEEEYVNFSLLNRLEQL